VKPDGAECAFGKKGQEPIDPGLWGPLQAARPTASRQVTGGFTPSFFSPPPKHAKPPSERVN
jgi:hypothetical protein